jgi:hypothetical protein
VFEEHRTGRADYGKLLYAITMFGCWWRNVRVAAKPAAFVA